MADKRITELPAAGALTGTELIEVVQGGVNKQSTTQDIADLGGGGGTWGSITGTLSAQTDLYGYLRATRTVTSADAIVQADDNGWIIFNSATPFNFTLDQLTANLVGNETSKASFVNIGAGAVTFVNGTGVTATGDLVLAGAVGNSFPTAVVYYDTATTPRVVMGSIKLYSSTTLGTNTDGAPDQNAVKIYVDKRTVDSVSVDTSGGTITLDFSAALKIQRMFYGSDSFATAKAIAFANEGDALVMDFHYEITNVAAVLTWPADVISGDSRWSAAGNTITHTVIGVFEASLTWNEAASVWVLKVGQAAT